MTEAAAVPETFFTVHYNLFMRTSVRPGETVLVHGGSSGIGTTAIQLIKAAGASAIVTAGSAEKCRFCEELGADHAVDYRRTDWLTEVQRITDGAGVDVVLDIVGGDYVGKNLQALKRDGRYVIIAFLKSSVTEVDLRAVLAKRLTITGSLLRPQTTTEKAAIAASLEAAVLPKIADGSVRPIIHETFPLAEAAAAHALMESSRHMGKIVLVVSPESTG